MLLAMCAATILLLPPGEKPTKLDLWTVERAKERCPVLYPDSPCAKSVERRRNLNYRVICTHSKKD